MAKKSKEFTITPMEIPRRRTSSKYSDLIETFIDSADKSARINTDNGVKMNAMYSGFYRVIKKDYSDKVSVSRVDGELYIEKL